MIEVLSRVKCSSKTSVELIKHGNDDDTVRDAARVSHAACAESASPTLIDYLAKNDHFTPFGHARYSYSCKLRGPDGIIKWLINKSPGWSVSRHSHEDFTIEGSLYNWLSDPEDLPPIDNRQYNSVLCSLVAKGCRESVRAFVDADWYNEIVKPKYEGAAVYPGTWKTFRIKAPVFVLRQMMRSNHEIVYNEISRRYIKSDPEFYFPEEWRRAPKGGIKQGSGEGSVRTFDKAPVNEWIAGRGFFPFAVDLDTAYSDWLQTAEELYGLYIKSGVAPELARAILPVSHYSEVWMTASPKAIQRITGLRSNRGKNNHAQKEIEEVSRAIETCLEEQAL